MYKTILRESIYEEEVKKSKFIAYLAPVQSKEEAEDYILSIKDKHKDARHNCSAYIIGEEGLIQKYDDDGEPQKTAGPPILDVLKNKELKNVVCVVTRYFGGILLGAGGLIRAYSGACTEAVNKSKIVTMESFEKIRFTYDYTCHGSIENYLLNHGYPMEEQEFLDKVTISTYVGQKNKDTFIETINDKTSGNLEVVSKEEIILPTYESKLLWKGNLYKQGNE